MPEDEQRTRTVVDDLDDLGVLKRFEQELIDAEATAREAYGKVESLRGIVTNLRRYLGMPQEPRRNARSATPAELAYIQANNIVRVEQQRIAAAARRELRHTTTVPVPRADHVALPGEAPTPRGRDAVRQILIETRRTMHTNDLVAETKARGWMKDVKDPWNALSAAAKRLVSDGEVESMGRAQYRYRLDKLPPAEEDQPSSGTPDGPAEASAGGQGRLLAEEGGDV